MDQYYETASYFAQIDLKGDPQAKGATIGGTAVEGAKPLYEIVGDKKDGDVMHLRTNKPVAPKVPFDAELVSKTATTRRDQFATWMTSSDNDYFAMSYANRIWGYLTGTGVIEPLDDIRAGNPPSNPELLQYLTNEFIQSGFNVRHLMRLIATSRTYNLSLATNKWNEDDKTNYSHAKARRLPAEVLFDSVFAVTGSMPNIPGVPKGTRAAALADAQIKLQDGFLTNFGRPARESVCECERSNDVNLGPVMALMSGPTVGDAISDPGNAIAKLTAEIQDDRQLVDAIFRPRHQPPRHAQGNRRRARQAWPDSMRRTKHSPPVAQAKEAEQKPLIAKAEQERLLAIDTAKKELEAYKVKMAPEVKKQEEARLAAIKKAEGTVKAAFDTAPAKQPNWENYLDLTTEWHLLDLKPTAASGASKNSKCCPMARCSPPRCPKASKPTATTSSPANRASQGITAIKLEMLPDDRLPNNGPGLAPDGNFVLGEFIVTTDAADAKRKRGSGVAQTLKSPKADFEQKDFPVTEALKKGNRDRGWAVSPEGGFRHEATFQFEKPITNEGGTSFTIQMTSAFQNGKYNPGRFRLWVTNSPTVRFGVPADVAAALKAAKRTPAQTATLTAHFLNQFRDYQAQKKLLANAKKPLAVDPQLIALETKHTQRPKPHRPRPQAHPTPPRQRPQRQTAHQQAPHRRAGPGLGLDQLTGVLV
jgi:hypothetical protein